MSMMPIQITNLAIAYSTVYPGADQRKYRSSASLAFVRGIHRWPWREIYGNGFRYISSQMIYHITLSTVQVPATGSAHDDVIKWKHFPRYWLFVRGIHWSPVNSPHKGQWRGALMFSLICAWTSDWVNNGKTGDLKCHRPHYDVIVIKKIISLTIDIDIIL